MTPLPVWRMPLPMTIKSIVALAFAMQFLILAYVYRGVSPRTSEAPHRVRAFRYLVWAWGVSVATKMLVLTLSAFPEATAVLPLAGLSMAAVTARDLMTLDLVGELWRNLGILGAGLSFRWGYRLRWSHAAVAAGSALAVGLLGEMPVAEGGARLAGWFFSGGTLIAAGFAFWPSSSSTLRYLGARLLASTLSLWGGFRVVVALFVNAPPGTEAALAVHIILLLFYFLTVFACIIMVLDRARSEMVSLKEFNETLVDGLGEGLELVDGTFTVRHANRWMREQFGAVVGRRCYEVLTADRRPCPGCPLPTRHEMTAPVRLEIRGPAGRHFALTCSPMRRADGEVGLLELVADVTEQERIRARLKEAEQLAKVGELAAGVAHEIRNPLAAIVNAAVLLEQEEALAPEERTSTLTAVKKEARRLNAILSDFLRSARPRGAKRLRGDIRSVVDHVAALIREAGSGDVSIDIRTDPAVPAFAFDVDQITQVLWNIALNGVQAMAGRGVLSFEVDRTDGRVRIAVSDTGRGIPEAERERIFDPFFSRKPGGTGLGLAIARRIVVAHGGEIHVESAPDRGSRFTITLPVAGE